MTKTYFTSDLHFFHKNIVKFTERPTTIEHHNDWLITRLNTVIGEDDEVYHLGDFSFGKQLATKEILSRLNGKWHFVLGNHDNESMLRDLCKGTKHKVLGHYHEMRHSSKKIVLCHYPMISWNSSHRKSIQLHGHCHGDLTRRKVNKYLYSVLKYFNLEHKKPQVNQMDVGLDNSKTHLPFEINDLLKLIEKNNGKRTSVGHH